MADSSDSDDDEGDIMFDPIPLYKQILDYLKPGETVSKTLCRLGTVTINNNMHTKYAYNMHIKAVLNKYILLQSR